MFRIPVESIKCFKYKYLTVDHKIFTKSKDCKIKYIASSPHV